MPTRPLFQALSLVIAAGACIWAAGDDGFPGTALQPERDRFATPDRSLITSSFKTVDRSRRNPASGEGDTSQIVQAAGADPSTPADITTSAERVADDRAGAMAVAAGAASTTKVDESALRYFASRGDTVRLQAEIARLRALYPNWTPPTDPLAVPQNEDTQLEAMWKLYAESRYADVRTAIAGRRAAEPDWVPPADLLDRLSVAEARAGLIRASDTKRYDDVVRLASETPSLLTCSEVDVLWRVADAFARTDRLPRARDAYMYVLDNCERPAERLATVQKAAALLPYASMQDLLARERPGADGGMEFDSIRDDLARRFVADGNGDTALVVAPDFLRRVETLWETGGLASDALLLAWYKLRRNDIADAEKWFRRARAKEDSATASQGLALALIARKSPLEAEDVMYRWRGDSDGARATYFAATANLLASDPPAVLSADVLQRIAKAVVDTREAATAQQFGWYARALAQYGTAADWFRAALAWKPDDEPSAYGLAITLAQLRDRDALRAVQQAWEGRSERIATLGDSRGRSRQPGIDGTETNAVSRTGRVVDDDGAVVRSRPRRAVPVEERVAAADPQPGGCSTTLDPQSLSPAAALPRGWCLMEMNRPMEAIAAFEVALGGTAAKTREDAAYGQSLAYLRAGLTSRASVAATRMPQTRKRAAELQIAILTDRATAASKDGRYRDTILILDQLAQLRPEQVDLMVLRGYAYLNLGRLTDAYRIFEAAARSGNRAALGGLADVKNAKRGVY